MRFKKKETETFSLSFLDCICCGFGAVLLLFVLTAGQKASTHDQLEAQILEVIGQRDNDIALKDKELRELRRSLALQRNRNKETDDQIEIKKKLHSELEEELKLLLQKLLDMEEELAELMKDKEEIPKEDEKPPIPIPNEIRRQYLTGFDLDGNNVLFLVEASGGMMDDTVEAVAARLQDDDEKKSKAPKWVRVKKGLRWLIANLKPESNYKIIFFNKDVTPIKTETGLDWFTPSDREMTVKVLAEIDKIVPKEGMNLEKGINAINQLAIKPDRLVLIVDGLPNISDSYSTGSVTSDYDRIAMFKAALKNLPSDLPVNTILYPFSGDPGATVHYWRLADQTEGALVSPAVTWPNI